MADITDISSYAVGEKVQYYLSYLDAPPQWYSCAEIIAINPPTNHTNNETFDISSTIICRKIKDNVRPYHLGGELNVGQICRYIIRTDEDGNVAATLPYTIISIQNDGALVLNFTQRGMHADHLHKIPPEVNSLIVLITGLTPINMMVLLCVVMIVCTDNVISHDETGTSWFVTNFPITLVHSFLVLTSFLTHDNNTGDGPKSPFALITPTGCNPLVGQRLYGNDSGMMLSDQGWQFFQRVG